MVGNLEGRSGVYTIWEGDRPYVGSAVDLGKRLRRHRSDLLRGEHDNKFLQRAFDKYGWESFRVDIEFCDGYTEPELRKFELVMMDRLEEAGMELFNMIEPDTNPMLGRHHTEEARLKMSEAAIGRKSSFLGRQHSEEARQKIREAAKRRGQDPEYRDKQSRSWTEERRKKQSDKMKGNQQFLGRKHSKETKRKMIISQKARRRRERDSE